MKQYIVLGPALVLALASAGCATRGYVRKQAGLVNDRVSQVQPQVAALNEKHDKDAARVNERVTVTETKIPQAAEIASQANASATQANASAARAEASATAAQATRR